MCSWTIQVIRQVREIYDNGLTKVEDFGKKNGESGELVQYFVHAREYDFSAVYCIFLGKYTPVRSVVDE